MEIIYAIFYTIGIALLCSQYEDVICEYILRCKGQKEIEAEIIGFGNNNIYPYNRGGFDYRSRSLVKIKYRDSVKECMRFIYRDKDDRLHGRIQVLLHPKKGCVIRGGGRRTYYSCSRFTEISIKVMSGIGWFIELGIVVLTLWWVLAHRGNLLFVVLYSLVAAAIVLFVTYHLMMGEQDRIDKHSFTL